MKTATLSLAMGFIMLAFGAVSVSAQQSRNCAPRAMVVERLADKYGESRQSIGIGAQGAVVEVFASQDTGSWTITVTSTNGMTCLVASGQSFETLAEALPTKENDA